MSQQSIDFIRGFGDQKQWKSPPRARDVAFWRNELVESWSPRGTLTGIVPTLEWISGGHHSFKPGWEYMTLKSAALYFVGAEMCELLTSAAGSLPPTPLDDELLPEPEGLVVFESALAGIDAEGSANPVGVGAMLWGPALLREEGDIFPITGITVYGPMSNPPHLVPLGSLVWGFTMTADQQLGADTEEYAPDTAKFASMVEDRRRLQALWLLSSQLRPSITNVEEVHPDRAARRQAERSGRQLSAVKVVTLRKAAQHDPEPGDSKRVYSHRWVVSGHWRQQAYGPKRGLHRPVYITAFLKGPANAPVIGGAKVKAWTK